MFYNNYIVTIWMFFSGFQTCIKLDVHSIPVVMIPMWLLPSFGWGSSPCKKPLTCRIPRTQGTKGWKLCVRICCILRWMVKSGGFWTCYAFHVFYYTCVLPSVAASVSNVVEDVDQRQWSARNGCHLRSVALWITAPAWQVGIWHLVAECVAWQQQESMALVATSRNLHYGAIQL